ncbi:MAG: SGNH/GDSL hydrolase family protein [Myxococcales bacterium]|nr:SGNH/GDSL hydrolase family protein [Myxococcales bacterium]
MGDIGVPPKPYGPAFYPAGRTHSPITPYVADRMREAALLGPDMFEDVFMKTGASSTVSHNTLHCFADDPIELGDHQELDPTLQFFLGGDAAGSTPFDRETEAALVGHHAGWAISGDPSPIDIEVGLLSPRLALVHFGANDMGWGETYGDALLYFHTNMMLMVDGFLDQGIVPIIFGITRRGDYASAQRWVGTWNATLRGIAQARQIPFVDLYHAIDPLPGHGLASDGLHLEAYSGGACVLDDEGLQHGYNIRNLVALEALDRAVAVLVDDAPGIDPATAPLEGRGTPDEPLEIPMLPFTDSRNTAEQGDTFVDQYTGCDSTSDESGPEIWYRLELEQTTRIRAAVLDMEGVDIDVHLVDESATGDGCLARGHHFVETTLEPGTYHFALDTWVSDGTPLAGEYLFVLVECEDDDASCSG